MDIRVLVVNLNNIYYTKNCINDLLKQDIDNFKITLVDQNSSEIGTDEFLSTIPDRVEIIRNTENKPLNSVWNWFYETYSEELLCFLNNDVRITKNFISDTINTFKQEDNVGIAVHATNHPKYKKTLDELTYVVNKDKVNMQGWDFTIRRKCYSLIPKELKTYCGDDFIFQKNYDLGYDLAYILSSPMIHFEGKSKRFMNTSGIEDIHKYISLGNKHHLKINQNYSMIKPTFKKLDDGS